MVDGMGQRRRGNKATYFWTRPWEGEAPPENDTLWVSTDQFDVLGCLCGGAGGQGRKDKGERSFAD